MGEAFIEVLRAGALVTLQDAGRPGRTRFGIPASGPLDRLGHAVANAACGNPWGATAVEVSLAGLTITGDMAITMGFAAAHITVDGRDAGTGSGAITVPAGAEVSVQPMHDRRWAYLAVSGRLMADQWLGSTSTHASSGFGGGALGRGMRLTVVDASMRSDLDGPLDDGHIAFGAPVRVCLGPQEHAFVDAAVDVLRSAQFRVTDRADRMGMRLDGPPLTLDGALTIPSEPVVCGAIQVAGDGVPVVLLADHQTTGGYPKIATVVSVDRDRLAQQTSGSVVEFEVVSPPQAVALVRTETARRIGHLSAIAAPDRTLAQRLHTNDLGAPTRLDGADVDDEAV